MADPVHAATFDDNGEAPPIADRCGVEAWTEAVRLVARALPGADAMTIRLTTVIVVELALDLHGKTWGALTRELPSDADVSPADFTPSQCVISAAELVSKGLVKIESHGSKYRFVTCVRDGTSRRSRRRGLRSRLPRRRRRRR